MIIKKARGKSLYLFDNWFLLKLQLTNMVKTLYLLRCVGEKKTVHFQWNISRSTFRINVNSAFYLFGDDPNGDDDDDSDIFPLLENPLEEKKKHECPQRHFFSFFFSFFIHKYRAFFRSYCILFFQLTSPSFSCCIEKIRQ